MRLDVTVEEEVRKLTGTGGWFRTPKTRPEWDVLIRIHLTEEERAIATKHNLWSTKIYFGEYSPDRFESMSAEENELLGGVTRREYYLDWLVNGLEGRSGRCSVCATFYSPQAAKQFEQHLINDVMPKVKALIYDSAEPNVGSRSYEI
jgi:hypothetical protein